MDNMVKLESKQIEIKEGVLLNFEEEKFQNYISTTLYNKYNFIPLSIYNQVKKFTNIYFIIIGVLSLIPVVSTISPLSAISPVIFIIFFSISFDLYEDFQRYRRDK